MGGERFDKLVEKISGVKVPGTGFGLGFDRTLEATEQFNLIPSSATTTKILVTVFDRELLSESLLVANKLRETGINTELYPNSETKLDKQLKYADKKGIPYVAIIGDTEAKSGQITLKNLATGDQQTLPLDKLLSILK